MHERVTLGFGLTSDWMTERYLNQLQSVLMLSQSTCKYFRHSIGKRSSLQVSALDLKNGEMNCTNYVNIHLPITELHVI